MRIIAPLALNLIPPRRAGLQLTPNSVVDSHSIPPQMAQSSFLV